MLERMFFVCEFRRPRSLEDVVSQIPPSTFHSVLYEIDPTAGREFQPTPVSLHDLSSGNRILTPARSVRCTHIQCFDVRSFLAGIQRTGVCLCPVCGTAAPVSTLRVDSNFQNLLDSCGNECTQLCVVVGRIPLVDTHDEKDDDSEEMSETMATMVDDQVIV